MSGSPLASVLESRMTSPSQAARSTLPILVLPMCGSTTGWPTFRRPWWTRCPDRGRVTLASMLTISGALQAKIIAHARADHPDEACGVIAGPAGQDRPERFIPMTNAERSPTFYRFDSMEQLRVWREMDDRDEEAVVIYHSHPATEAYPSRTDISYAMEPAAHYRLVSTREPDGTEVRSFTIIGGAVTEEQVQLVGDGVEGSRPEVSCYRRLPAARYTWPATPGELQMAIEVRIPTILRTFTSGAKSVEGSGDTLDALIADLDSRHAGLRDRLVDDSGLRRFVNVYLNDEDVRFLGGLSAPVKDGDTITVLPAVAGGMR